MLILNHRY